MAEDLGAEVKERITTVLTDAEYAKAFGFLRRATNLTDAELLRQAIVRLHEEVKGAGALTIRKIAA